MIWKKGKKKKKELRIAKNKLDPETGLRESEHIISHNVESLIIDQNLLITTLKKKTAWKASMIRSAIVAICLSWKYSGPAISGKCSKL